MAKNFEQKHIEGLRDSAGILLANGKKHFEAGMILVSLPIPDPLNNGTPITRNGKAVFLHTYFESALLLFQASIEFKLKGLIKLKESSSFKTTHDLLYLWRLASKHFQKLCSIKQEDKDFLKDFTKDSNFINFKYGSMWRGDHLEIKESICRISELLDVEIKTEI